MKDAKVSVNYECNHCEGSGKNGKTVEEAMEYERNMPLGGVITMGAPPDCYDAKLTRIMQCPICSGSGRLTKFIPLHVLLSGKQI